MIPIVLLNNVRRFASGFAFVANFFLNARGLSFDLHVASNMAVRSFCFLILGFYGLLTMHGCGVSETTASPLRSILPVGSLELSDSNHMMHDGDDVRGPRPSSMSTT